MAQTQFLYLSIEEANRELLSRILITVAALKRGFTVVLGQQWLLNANFHRLPAGVVLFKGNNKIQAHNMRIAKQSGHQVASIEEEAFACAYPEETLRYYDGGIPRCCDLVLAHGEAEQIALLARFPGLDGRICVTGNPRAEILANNQGADVSEMADVIQQEHGRFILVNASSASINPFDQDVYGIFESFAAVGLLRLNDPADLKRFQSWCDWQRKNLHELIDFLFLAAKAAKDLRFIIRPHPAEDPRPWQRTFANASNIKVIGGATIWPGYARATSCFILDRPRVSRHFSSANPPSPCKAAPMIGTVSLWHITSIRLLFRHTRHWTC